MRTRYRIAKFKFFIVRLLSCFVFSSAKRKEMRSKFLSSQPLLNNEFIVIDESGKHHLFPKYKNCSITFSGSGNKLIIHEPQQDLRNFKVLFNGDNSLVEIKSSNSVIHGLNIFKIGTNSKATFGQNFSTRGCFISFSGEDNLNVQIGKNCLFSSEIKFQPTDSHSIFDIKTGECLNFGEDIIIGNHVWVCRNVIFLKGVKVPDNSVVATNAVVTSPPPIHAKAGVILAGVPAKVVKEGINWSGRSPKFFERK